MTLLTLLFSKGWMASIAVCVINSWVSWTSLARPMCIGISSLYMLARSTNEHNRIIQNSNSLHLHHPLTDVLFPHAVSTFCIMVWFRFTEKPHFRFCQNHTAISAQFWFYHLLYSSQLFIDALQ